MINTLLGIKKHMTSGYDARGRRVGATIISVEPNQTIQIKTIEGKDGYSAVQLGISQKKSVKKPQLGHLKKVGIDQSIRWMREVRSNEEMLTDLEPGKALTVGQVFSVGDSVKVTGISKGKGFQGVVRRHGFHGGPKTHGQSDRHRAPGSIGSGTTPGRVYKGKKMAGHMGSETISTLGLEILNIDKKNHLLTIKGAVPGPIGGLITITKTGKIKGYIAPPEEKEEEEEEVASDVEQMKGATEEQVQNEAATSELTEEKADSDQSQNDDGNNKEEKPEGGEPENAS